MFSAICVGTYLPLSRYLGLHLRFKIRSLLLSFRLLVSQNVMTMVISGKLENHAMIKPLFYFVLTCQY